MTSDERSDLAASDAPESVGRPDFVVGIGSSAGGLEALEGLIGSLQPDGRTAFVVAQHLAPDYPSLLVELLTRSTGLTVVQATNELPLQPDVIVISPPGRDVAIADGRVSVRERETAAGPHPSIDLLLESIADEWGDHAVGVILSGTGSDGAYGMRRIKAGDGLTIVQSPESAQFASMPRATLSLGVGDLVLAPAEIGQRLSRLGTAEVDWLGDVLPDPAPDVLTSITAELRRSTGVDFSRYKESTLLRQVKRRMAILQVYSIDDYLPLLVADPAESAALMNGLLVTVTSFFRDPESFAALREKLADYLASRESHEPLRVWVPGCATGEEVYSVAMLMSELLGRPADLEDRVKIFGTDLDEAALAIARRGVYPGDALGRIPAELASRYLMPISQGAEVLAELRGAVVFARHNVGQDPPFPRLDLISCRNTLIYFTPPLQRRVLEMFAYALVPGGLLFLGASESPAAETVGFDVVDANHRILQRTHEVVVASRTYAPGPMVRMRELPTAPLVGRAPRALEPDTHVAVLEALAVRRTHPCVVVNERNEVVEVVGDVLPYVQLPQGPMSSAVAALLRPELVTEARALLLLVRARGEKVSGRSIQVDGTGEEVRLAAGPLVVGERRMTILEFVAETAAEEPATPIGDRGPEFDAELDRLERELLSSQESLQASLTELETTHEELLASNEELQASSEELQSSYEELATSNEELQASNEELSVANRQLRDRTEELDRLRREAEDTLGDFTRVTDALREAVWQRDTSFSRLLYVSRRVEDLVGRSREELGEDASLLDDCIVEEDRDRVWASRSADDTGWAVDYRIVSRQGVERWVTERGTVVHGVRGGDRVVGTLSDVTEQMHSVRREGEQKAIFESVFQAPFFGVAILDGDFRVVMANPALCDLLGYDASSIVRMPFGGFFYPGATEGMTPADLVRPDQAGTVEYASVKLMRRDGSACWANLDLRPLAKPVGQAARILIVRDVTLMHEQTSEIARRSAIDAATGLLNREHFQRDLARVIEECEQVRSPLALAWVDVDQFKEVNDQYGHATGDEVLRVCAERLESAVRPSDVVGRVGGDEFGVILPGYAGATELEDVLDRMLWALRQPIPAGDAEVVITCSVGATVYPEDGRTPDTLMQAGNVAMHAVKDAGGDAVAYFRNDMTKAAEQRRVLRAGIDAAIAQNQFEMFYQPIIDAGSGALWGVEALIRWNRDGVVVPATEYIDFCESSGQIRALAPVTFAMFRRDLEEFRDAGCDVGRAGINLSATQLEDRHFTDLLSWWPSPSGLEGVVIEVTESVFLPDHANALAALRTLSDLGAQISVDDFGSGYSNLILLESLAPACIKLDRSFLVLHAQDGRGTDLIAAAIAMAHAIDSLVVAEGIENADQLTLVKRLGADLAQGFAIARPMSRRDLIEWVRARGDRG